MIAPTPIALADAVRERLLATDVAALASELGLDADRAAAWSAAWRRLGEPPRVRGALDLAREAQDGLKLPCLVSAALGEGLRDDLSPTGTGTIQRAATRLAVTVGVPARNDARGARAAVGDGALDALVSAVRARLVGWPPARRWDPLTVRSSRLLSLEGGRAWWQDEYETHGWSARPRQR